MLTIESLQTKRAQLVEQGQQFVGQVNRINGAVALLDDLIAEQNAAQPEVPNTAEDAAAAQPEVPSTAEDAA